MSIEWSNMSCNNKISQKKKEGALDRARTDDLRLIRATRYQLRYESCARMMQGALSGCMNPINLNFRRDRLQSL